MLLREPAYQDAVESQALYNVLENEVIPCFYEQRNGELPVRWVKMMKACLSDFRSLWRYGSDDAQRRRGAEAYAGADGLGLSDSREHTPVRKPARGLQLTVASFNIQSYWLSEMRSIFSSCARRSECAYFFRWSMTPASVPPKSDSNQT
jgi:glucan phosphorylase